MKTSAVRYALAATLCAATAYWARRSVTWTSVAAALAAARPFALIAAVVSVLVTLALVTVRWRLLLRGTGRPIRWSTAWNGIVIGQAVNIVVPLRFGELARIAITSRAAHVGAASIATPLVLERLFDIMAFACGAIAVAGLGLLPAHSDTLRAAVGFSVLSAAALVAAIRLTPYAVRGAEQRRWLPDAAARWIRMQANAVDESWATAARPATMAATAVLTIAVVATAASTNVLVAAAFDVKLPAVAALALLVALQAGTSLVSVPGNVGVFHYVAILVLRAWDVPASVALGIAIVLHIISLGPKVILGALALAWSGGLRSAVTVAPEPLPSAVADARV